MWCHCYSFKPLLLRAEKYLFSDFERDVAEYAESICCSLLGVNSQPANTLSYKFFRFHAAGFVDVVTNIITISAAHPWSMIGFHWYVFHVGYNSSGMDRMFYKASSIKHQQHPWNEFLRMIGFNYTANLLQCLDLLSRKRWALDILIWF